MTEAKRSMTPAEFTRRRKAIFKTPTDAARAMGVSTRCVTYWESGERNMSPMAQILWGFIEAKMRSSSNRTLPATHNTPTSP